MLSVISCKCLPLRETVRFVWNHPLNAHNRALAIWRLLWWQAASRVRLGVIPLPFVEGTHLLARRGMTGATGNWYCGLHEVNEMAFLLHVLRPGEHFLDVGANIGSYTVLAAGAVRARVTSVEPVPTTFERLEQNIEANGLHDLVTAWQGALSSRVGYLRFTSTLDTVNRVLLHEEDAPSVQVCIQTMDQLIGPDPPVVIKIDVEGHELAVLRGGPHTLKNKRLLAVIMETNGSGRRYGVSDKEILLAMAGYGFAAHSYDPFERRLLDAAPEQGSTIFVRDRAVIEGRVRLSKKYRLVNGMI